MKMSVMPWSKSTKLPTPVTLSADGLRKHGFTKVMRRGVSFSMVKIVESVCGIFFGRAPWAKIITMVVLKNHLQTVYDYIYN